MKFEALFGIKVGSSPTKGAEWAKHKLLSCVKGNLQTIVVFVGCWAIVC